MILKLCLLLSLAALLTGCGSGSSSGDASGPSDPAPELGDASPLPAPNPPITESPGQQELKPTQPVDLDRSCDDAEPLSPAWTTCELNNFAKTLEAPTEQLAPQFLTRYVQQSVSNATDVLNRALLDPSWILSTPIGLLDGVLNLSVNTPVTPLCATYGLPCTGDPFRYPNVDGPDGRDFYENEADVTDVIFFDRDCARLSGTLWIPRSADPERPVPGIVITNGSVQAPQTAYSWAAQAFVRGGYAVFTYDPRGQGRSDLQTPLLQQGGNINPKIFWEGQVDAIDFFRSSPSSNHPHAERCDNVHRTTTQAFNPEWSRIDHSRLGIAGHSLGAIGVSVVQGYGAEGAAPWPGILDDENPVTVAVAWDSLITPEGQGLTTATNLQLPAPLNDVLFLALSQDSLPRFEPRVPAMSIFADYGFAPLPYITAPDPNGGKVAFRAWQDAGVPAYAVSFQGTTHFDFSLLPQFPATSWCPNVSNNACAGGWGRPSIEHYTLAWFDRWMKRPGEEGYEDADMRLIDDAREGSADRMSFHYHSARDFPDRFGGKQICENIRAGC